MGAHGSGTIVPVRTRRKDGSIRVRYRAVVTMPNGRRVWRTMTTEAAAERERQQLVRARELDLDPTRQTLEDYLRAWIAGQRERLRRGRGLRERTLIGYEQLIEGRILPGLGRVKLAQLTKRKVQAWVDTADGSPGTVRNAYAVLRKALGPAVGDVLPSNPTIGVELPDRPAYRGRPLTADEAHHLLEVTRGDRLFALWRLALVTGLREGELLGLSRDALEGDVLRVESQLQRVGRRWTLGPTKAARQLGRIALDPATVDVLRGHLARMAEERRPEWRYFGLMFPTETGEPYHEAQVLREFGAACDVAGIPRRRFHDLRHTSNRLLKDTGAGAEVRKARLGHSSDAMTEHYGGASEVLDRAAVAAVAEAIG